ncbi:MAG: DNA helicase PcrA [Clostridia bacterium]|nr:DNA helicase PcrA [Clostridia bacterium]
MIDYGTLNKEQLEAVKTTEGPLLIIAGAGSGKTRVLTHRVAYLISEKNVKPYNILAITFTNKAAREMKERVENLIGENEAKDIWISTFHAACVRILRRDIDKLGFDKNFVIFDTSDQKTLMKEVMKELNLDDKAYPVQYILAEISKAKNALTDTKAFMNMYQTDFRLSKVADAYALYQKKLTKNNALDFDDIIMKTITLFIENSDVLSYYQNKFKYIMVDEYQDTNTAQFTLVSLLASGFGNICVVGDDDQSIYGWRGADIRNILEFEKQFVGAKVIKLEQNYRSTSNILNAANEVIKNNKGRKAKKLWTENGNGQKVHYERLDNEYQEGRYIVDTIKTIMDKGERRYSDIGVLYRMNAQSRVIEEALMSEAIPYKVIGGLRFYDRKEIKDIIAYLRVIHNPSDFVSMKRIINVPKRSIGTTTVDKIQSYAESNGITVWEVINNIDSIPGLARSTNNIKDFVKLIKDFREMADNQEEYSVSDLITSIIEDSGYKRELEAENTVENETRIENLMEFVSVAVEYENEAEEPNLGEFLENIALVADVDEDEGEDDAVTLMTLHSAKGLEFPVVFLPGLEEGVFPSYRSITEDADVEEERRLCYVGITRAREELYISSASSRTLFGNTSYNKPSRFLEEIPEDFMEGYVETKVQKENYEYVPKRPSYNSVVGFGYASKINGYSMVADSIGSVVNNDISQFKPGVHVNHRKFGYGIISSVEPEGDDLKLEIMFDSVGMKRLMAKYAQLEVMNNE